MGKETLESLLKLFLNEQLQQLIISKPVEKGGIEKIKIRPILLRETLTFQAEEFTKTQAFHKNLSLEEVAVYIEQMITTSFRQLDAYSALGSGMILVSKKGQMAIKVKRTPVAQVKEAKPLQSHNRKKQHVLEEGKPVPFLEDLGIMTPEGKVVASYYDKFRQINRYLEFIEDILPRLDKSKTTTIIDFGCGKSYLTFAMYYYLYYVKEYPIRVIGLDLKEEVIKHCSQLAGRYGFEHLTFLCGDIASFEGVEQVDMVVTLHACDTATDFAMAKAVHWGAKVILSVPCCQHELNAQMGNELLQPIFQYGIIKERMAALYTDALRAELLESVGYRTQILEFIDMEHTPKNLLIRAVWDGKPKDNQKEIKEIFDFLGIEPTLLRLLVDSKF